MKNPVTIAFSLVFSLLSTLSITAQVDMRWDLHGIGFEVPKNFIIQENNADAFTAGNDFLFLTIAPIQDASLTEEDLADAVVAMATEMEYDDISEGDEIEVGDLYGYYIKGVKDGAHAVVMAMLDVESSTNILVIIVYAEGFEDEAINMAASFYAYD